MTEQDRKLIIDLLRMLDGLRRKLKEFLDKTT